MCPPLGGATPATLKGARLAQRCTACRSASPNVLEPRVPVLFTSTMLRKAGRQHFCHFCVLFDSPCFGEVYWPGLSPRTAIGSVLAMLSLRFAMCEMFCSWAEEERGLINLGWHGVFGMHLVGPTKLSLPDHCKVGKLPRGTTGAQCSAAAMLPGGWLYHWRARSMTVTPFRPAKGPMKQQDTNTLIHY